LKSAVVDRVTVGDRVCQLFYIGCGFCENCEKGLTDFCLTENPDSAGTAYGFADMDLIRAGMLNCVACPMPISIASCFLRMHKNVRMTTSCFRTSSRRVGTPCNQPVFYRGESIAIYGAGPVGLMAAHSVMIKGASQVFLVDSQPNRLKLAAQLGATPINSVEKEAVDQILNLTQGKCTDRGCECVGYQCCDRHGHNANHLTMNNLVASTKTNGGIGVVGIFCSARPGRRKRAGETRQDGLRFRRVLVPGAADPHRPSQR
jgi:threonine dehydrogenase-like Zn-dependent dehydrogenase